MIWRNGRKSPEWWWWRWSKKEIPPVSSIFFYWVRGEWGEFSVSLPLETSSLFFIWEASEGKSSSSPGWCLMVRYTDPDVPLYYLLLNHFTSCWNRMLWRDEKTHHEPLRCWKNDGTKIEKRGSSFLSLKSERWVVVSVTHSSSHREHHICSQNWWW